MQGKTFDSIIRVLVADDTRLHTQLMADALRRDGDLEVISSDSHELISRTDLHNIDVLLLSPGLDEQPRGGFAALREVRVAHPTLRAIVLLDSSKPESILEAFRAGACGVLSRQDSIETLCKCIRCVHGGQIWANSQQMCLVVDALASSRSPAATVVQCAAQLSRREIEVIGCVAQGMTNREIAERLNLSVHTVKNYLFKVFDKLGVSSRVELLFMTMNRAISPELRVGPTTATDANQDMQRSSVLIGFQRAAEQGVPTAQLELARYYWARRSDPRDLIQAYKWYLIAGQYISRTCKEVGKTLTMDQLLQAEQIATEWLGKTARIPPASVTNVRINPARGALRAGSR